MESPEGLLKFSRGPNAILRGSGFRDFAFCFFSGWGIHGFRDFAFYFFASLGVFGFSCLHFVFLSSLGVFVFMNLTFCFIIRFKGVRF